MTASITVATWIIAAAASIRSTWSPCGLSMLATITPIGERGRGNRYRSTAAWFIVGAVLGGMTLGAVMAGLAAGVRALDVPPTVLGAVVATVATVCAGSDAGLRALRLPVHHRQVNERWLDQFRSWVYGTGFGWQIGSGVTTYITTAGVYLMIVLAAATGRPTVAMATGTGFGLVRGLTVLLGRGLTGPDALRAFHRRFDATGRAVRTVTVVVQAVLAVGLAATVWLPAGIAVAAAAVLAATWAGAARRWLARGGRSAGRSPAPVEGPAPVSPGPGPLPA